MTTTSPESVVVDGHTYLRSDLTTDHSDSPVRIVVLQRGWVVVGYWSEDGDEVQIRNARVIRKWGTSRGLGELVDGPTTSTVLDPADIVCAHRLGVVLTIAANGAAWKDVLS